ncbi:hypothetical protein ACR34G_03810 [Mycoplasma sp. 480]|uniref:hypothetical protein n=1 Tax=Mycoplasma sp. 480 TaxID=3440155 RepID=UPI003F5104EA
MQKAGYWRRFLANQIDFYLGGLTFGIMFIVQLVQYCKGEATLGMKIMHLKYSYGKGRMLKLWLHNFWWKMTFISFIVDIITIVAKKGTFPEKWADNYIILDNKEY